MIYIVTILAFTIFIIIFYIITNRINNKNFVKHIEDLALQTKRAKYEFESIFNPTHLVHEKDVEDFMVSHKKLLDELYAIEAHKYYNDSIIENLEINSFKTMLTKRSEMIVENNKIFNAINDLRINANRIMDEYRTLMHPAHYFTFSELESFLSAYGKLQKNIDQIFPQYAKFVTDDISVQICSIFKQIQKDREEHNIQFVKSELENCKLYFDHVLGKYPLDFQQRDSIVKLEDNCLVIASAGSGKTSTIIGKAKYLIEKQNISPSKILILTYTKKAANELFERMQIDGLCCGTFHSLAYRIISEVTGQAPSICNADVPLNVFRKLILEDEKFLAAIDNYIINLQSLMNLEHDYLDAFSYFEDRKKYGIQALFPDVDGKIIFTRSEEEKRLCSILTRLGLMFRYECPYPFNTQTPERRQYKPDFTIYFQDKNGAWQNIYLEHFAIDHNGQTPRWFGEGTKGGWKNANKKYIEGIKWKRQIHDQKRTVLIETTSADFHDGTVEQKLLDQLSKIGVPIRYRTDNELYDMLIKRNKQLEKTVFTLLISFITLMKANEKTITGLLNEITSAEGNIRTVKDKRNYYIISEIVKPFYEAYQNELEKNFEIDFTDAIIQATALCNDGLWQHYDYILVDEFQDISIDRYKFLQALRTEKPQTKLYCVGDDWQSIFRFAGSDMALFYDFEKYFGYTEICKIETTYRFHQPLIDKSSTFIMKNPLQKSKVIKTPADDKNKTYLKFIKCNSEEKDTLNKVKDIIHSIPIDESILLIGRYNYDAFSLGFNGKIEMNDNRIKLNIAGRDIFFLSVHSAKGLEADHVILINCNQGAYGFPSLIEDDPILDFVLSKSERFPFAEERRLFYVAMTRTKKQIYILYDQQKPSPFIGEFLLKLEIGSYLCPKCLEGKVVPIKDGTSQNGIHFRSFSCSNREAGCDFFETRFGDLTPPGILVNEKLTAQDIEHMRDNRRKAKKRIDTLTDNSHQKDKSEKRDTYIPFHINRL